jgi:hypothetical protein
MGLEITAAAETSVEKVSARLEWAKRCREYPTGFTGSTGLFPGPRTRAGKSMPYFLPRALVVQLVFQLVTVAPNSVLLFSKF